MRRNDDVVEDLLATLAQAPNIGFLRPCGRVGVERHPEVGDDGQLPASDKISDAGIRHESRVAVTFGGIGLDGNQRADACSDGGNRGVDDGLPGDERLMVPPSADVQLTQTGIGHGTAYRFRSFHALCPESIGDHACPQAMAGGKGNALGELLFQEKRLSPTENNNADIRKGLDSL